MAKPKGAMSSPYTGFANEMKNTTMFDTVGTEQNLKPIGQEQQQAQAEPTVEQKEVTAETDKFTSNELSKIITAVTKIGKISSATPDSVQIELDGLKVKITK